MRVGSLILQKIRRYFLLVALAVPLSGCIAAAPLLLAASVATTGYLGYKTYQTISGAEVSVDFVGETIDPSASQSLGDADVFAFWASSDRTLVVAAEQVEQLFGFSEVISPSRAASILRRENLPLGVGGLTSHERMEAFEQYARTANADLVFAISEQGYEQSMNMLSLSRAQTTYRFHLYLYGKEAQAFLWTTEFQLIVGVGGSTPSSAELEDVVGRAIAERLHDIASGSIRHGETS